MSVTSHCFLIRRKRKEEQKKKQNKIRSYHQALEMHEAYKLWFTAEECVQKMNLRIFEQYCDNPE